MANTPPRIRTFATRSMAGDTARRFVYFICIPQGGWGIAHKDGSRITTIGGEHPSQSPPSHSPPLPPSLPLSPPNPSPYTFELSPYSSASSLTQHTVGALLPSELNHCHSVIFLLSHAIAAVQPLTPIPPTQMHTRVLAPLPSLVHRCSLSAPAHASWGHAGTTRPAATRDARATQATTARAVNTVSEDGASSCCMGLVALNVLQPWPSCGAACIADQFARSASSWFDDLARDDSHVAR